ncbi:hypothetical protein CEXT_491271 [Caerostris extrusa]|uniref:Uncharacterized protein n=1 Tax=Caerostris extrusa TaxID=172846 RepID=A0AAV4SUM5_CAEEX|nr:hypothetical protein CEXT_491271 [Caerostris extrusa]
MRSRREQKSLLEKKLTFFFANSTGEGHQNDEDDFCSKQYFNKTLRNDSQTNYSDRIPQSSEKDFSHRSSPPTKSVPSDWLLLRPTSRFLVGCRDLALYRRFSHLWACET